MPIPQFSEHVVHGLADALWHVALTKIENKRIEERERKIDVEIANGLRLQVDAPPASYNSYRQQLVFRIAKHDNNVQALPLIEANGTPPFLWAVVNSLLGTKLSTHVGHSANEIENLNNFKRKSKQYLKLIAIKIHHTHQLVLVSMVAKLDIFNVILIFQFYSKNKTRNTRMLSGENEREAYFNEEKKPPHIYILPTILK